MPDPQTSASEVNLETRILAMITEQHVAACGAPRQDWTAETPLELLELDALETVELIMAIEEEFHIEIPDDVVENMDTIGDLFAAVRGRAN